MENAAGLYPVVVIGGSAGSHDPLIQIINRLPPDFAAYIFVVVHMPSDAVSSLPNILARSGHLFAAHALEGAPLQPRRIIVAPPDSHLMVDDSAMHVISGPKENGHRPCIDVLFRSAANAFGSNAIGVLLSGSLDDGVDGLRSIRRAGGTTIVQSPEEAVFVGMPNAAIQAEVVDVVAPASEIADRLCDEVAKRAERGSESRGIRPAMVTPDERKEGRASIFTCPDCSGTLFELDTEGDMRFRCRTGHAYSAASLLAGQSDGIERGLWAAIRALEERTDLYRKLAGRAKLRGDATTAHRFELRATSAKSDIDEIQRSLDVIMGRARIEA